MNLQVRSLKTAGTFVFIKRNTFLKVDFPQKLFNFFCHFQVEYSWIPYLEGISWNWLVFFRVCGGPLITYFWYVFPEKFREQGWIVWFADPKMEHRLMLNQKGEAILSCKVSRITQYFRDLCFPVLRPLIINLIIYLNTILYL